MLALVPLLASLFSTTTCGDPSAPSSEAPAPAAADAKSRAQAEVDRALAAAARKDFRTALRHFEAALAIRPSPAIHYNIAACHHSMYLELQADDPGREQARRGAVDAYNEYLVSDPDAPDRDAVGQMVFELGGRPATLDDWSIEPDPRRTPHRPPTLRDEPTADDDPVPTTEEGPRPGSLEDPSEDPPEPPTPPPPGPAYRRGRVGLAFGITTANLARLVDSDGVASLPMLGGLFRGGAFVGARKRVNVGGELHILGQPTSTKNEHWLSAGSFAVAAEYGHPVGATGRLEVGGGGVLGFFVESLRHRGTTTTTCPANERAVSSRGGMLVAGRFNFAVLLGRERRHELGFRLTPGLGLAAAGSKGDGDGLGACDDGPSPFEELGLDGPELVVTFDIGYAPRF